MNGTEDMTWREFQLRKYGFERSEKRNWFKIRELGYASLVAGGMDPKKVSKEKYLPLEEKRRATVGSAAFEALKAAKEQYLKEINGSRT